MKTTETRRHGAVLPFLVLFVSVSPWLYPESTTVEIVCQKSFFTPNVIHVKKGAPLRLLLKSLDVPHGFAIDEFGIAREISPGPPVAIRFTPDREGEFAFYCVVRCGKDHRKMRGTLIVEP